MTAGHKEFWYAVVKEGAMVCIEPSRAQAREVVRSIVAGSPQDVSRLTVRRVKVIVQ